MADRAHRGDAVAPHGPTGDPIRGMRLRLARVDDVEPLEQPDGAQDAPRRALARHDLQPAVRLAGAAVPVDQGREAGRVDERHAAKVECDEWRGVVLELYQLVLEPLRG